MKVAVLISGRCVRYEVCLLPLLQKTKYDVDLFLSINDIDKPYYDKLRENLSPWIKGFYLEKFDLPKDFSNTHWRSLRQEIDGKYIPLHTMSMFFNDMNAFNMATKYADDNGFEYDNYLKFRADLIVDEFPEFIKSEELKIFSSVPRCDFRVPIVDRENKQLNGSVPIVCDAVAYGNRNSMRNYCDTYNFVLDINEHFDGNYPINFEDTLTHQVYDKDIPVERFNYKYLIDKNRRIFDNYKTIINSSGSVRVNHRNSLKPRDMDDVESTENIPPISDLA